MYIYFMDDHLTFKIISNVPWKSKLFLEQIKIFYCGRSHISTKNLIRQRHQAVQRDVARLGRIVLSLAKVLEEHVPLSDTQVLGIQNL